MEKAPYKEFHNLYRSPNIGRVNKSRRFKWAGHVTRMGGGRSTLKILIDKSIGKRSSGKRSRKVRGSIGMDL